VGVYEYYTTFGKLRKVNGIQEDPLIWKATKDALLP